MPKHDGYYCPNCGAGKSYTAYPEGKTAQSLHGSIYPTRRCRCSSCGATWMEMFRVIQYQCLVVPPPPNPVQELIAAAEAVSDMLHDRPHCHTITHYDMVRDDLKDAIKAMKSAL